MAKKKKPIEIHAARIGGCSRSLALHMRNKPTIEPSPYVMAIFDEGTRLEKVVLRDLKKKRKMKKGKTLSKTFHIRGRDVTVFGNPDFIDRENGYKIPGEIKSLNFMKFRNALGGFKNWNDPLRQKYGHQMLGYTILMDTEEVLWVIKEKTKRGESDGRMVEILIPLEELPSYKEWEARIYRALAIYEGEEVLPETVEKCNYCGYREICGSTETAVRGEYLWAELDKIDKPLIRKMKSKLKDLNLAREDINAREEEFEKFLSIAEMKYTKKVLEEAKVK